MWLTRRQREVVELLSQGASNRHIARTLSITERTAEGHVQQLLNTLGVSSRTEVATWWVLQQANAVAETTGEAQKSVTLMMLELMPDPTPAALPAERAAVLRRHKRLIAEHVGASEGRLVESPGPSTRQLAAFAAEADAATAALTIRRTIAEQLPSSDGSLAVRAIVHHSNAAQGPAFEQAVHECIRLSRPAAHLSSRRLANRRPILWSLYRGDQLCCTSLCLLASW